MTSLLPSPRLLSHVALILCALIVACGGSQAATTAISETEVINVPTLTVEGVLPEDTSALLTLDMPSIASSPYLDPLLLPVVDSIDDPFFQENREMILEAALGVDGKIYIPFPNSGRSMMSIAETDALPSALVANIQGVTCTQLSQADIAANFAASAPAIVEAVACENALLLSSGSLLLMGNRDVVTRAVSDLSPRPFPGARPVSALLGELETGAAITFVGSLSEFEQEGVQAIAASANVSGPISVRAATIMTSETQAAESLESVRVRAAQAVMFAQVMGLDLAPELQSLVLEQNGNRLHGTLVIPADRAAALVNQVSGLIGQL